MADEIHFTKAVIDTLPIPETRVYYRDALRQGLELTIHPTGVKVFNLCKRIGTKTVRFKIGKYPDVPPQVARLEATKLLAKIATGGNPQQERQQARRESADAKTVEEVWQRYRDDHLIKNCARLSARDRGYFFAALPANIQRKKLADITTAEIKQLHRTLTEKRGPSMANSVVGQLSTLFNFAADELGFAGKNPVAIRKAARGDRRHLAGIVLNPKKSRSRFLQPDELPAFFRALNAEPDQDVKDLLWLLLFTGARRGNVQAMRWADVSLERQLWIIPLSKNGDPVTIPLSRWAVEVLARRQAGRAVESPSEWVFPTRRASASGHIEEPKQAWWALVKRAGLTDFHMHDLRRTLATYQRTTGAPLEMIGASLGHRSMAATQIYARIDPAPVRAAVTLATQKLLDVGKSPLAAPAQIEVKNA